MIDERRLFVGNYDDGIHVRVMNIDDAFVGQTTGALALKCIEVAPRAVHTLGPDDAALLYEPLPQSYARYCLKLYGFMPRVFAPARRYVNTDQPLSLVRMALEDTALIETMAREGAERNWKLDPFIGNPLVFDLARVAGLSVSGIQERDVRDGRVVALNDKARFQTVCRELNIPLPDSMHVRGWSALVDATKRIYEEHGKAMLRRSLAAGGLGNCELNAKLMAKHGCGTVEDYLHEMLLPHQEWEEEIVLVEPVLDIVASPTVLAHVQGERVEIAGVIDQVLKNKAYIGGDYPTSESTDGRDLLIEWTRTYLRESFIPSGGQGWVDIDFGRLSNGHFVAFESNARTTGNNHGLAVRRRLCGARAESYHAWTNDALKVPHGTSFDQVLDLLDQSLLWNADRGDGTIITIPPGGNDDPNEPFSMGYIALARTMERKHALRDAMDDFARQSWVRLA